MHLPYLIVVVIYTTLQFVKVKADGTKPSQGDIEQLFDFEKIQSPNLSSPVSPTHPTNRSRCKTYPEDPEWPSPQQWKDFDTLLGGNVLIKTVPEASPCYTNDTATPSSPICQSLTSNWGRSDLRIEDPTSIRSVLFQGMTCMPPAYSPAFFNATTANKTTLGCDVGGFPEYTVNVSNVAQIQESVRFARKWNIRLVVKNTGHDFGGKSTGRGALSVWTHYLKDRKVVGEFVEGGEGGYVGTVVKLAAGVQVYEAYALAKEYVITLVGGEGKTVGHIGGYIQGGGHSPLTSIYGMAADHILSINLVTANSTFLAANATHNTDLFWAIRGGGGSTYGIVTSMLLKAYPRIPVTTMRYNMTTSRTFPRAKFWQAMKAYIDRFEEYADLGHYSYFRIRHVNGEIFHDMASWVAPNTSATDFRASIAPLLRIWHDIGVPFDPIITEYDNFSDAWEEGFPQEAWTWNMRQASRFFPREHFTNDTKRLQSFEAVKEVFEEGANLILFNMRNPPGSEALDNAVNPAWRKVLLFAIMFVTWAPGDGREFVERLSRNLTEVWNLRWRALTPGGGTYMSESDYIEPDWQQSFFGDKYPRLYKLKQEYDPEGVFYAQNAVGSEDWGLSEVLLGHLPSQNSRLCRK
ncbi:FAD-binding domain-containing protein [Byssothecium circinans]|uniref:FAD-binding domain-containing protein n=1 Tax=Byssothecium circinans TaxID=147558 RepID=A0A6A5UBA5_9PLEO|nr:FAD-binding domain-containing protein [Byssothecium circinans]